MSALVSSSTPTADDQSDPLSFLPEPNWSADEKAQHLALRLQAAERLRERLSCVPFYAKRAQRHKEETGSETEYWLGLLGRVDEPPKACSTAEMPSAYRV